MKKTTTPRKGAANKPNRAELRRKLARDIVSILNNPETPSFLYNNLADCVTTLEQSNDWITVDHIEGSLSNYLRGEETRKGGAR
jgi:hypothetical protein